MIAITGGILLNQLFDRAQQLIQQFENSGKSLEIEGGIQLRQTIEAARAAYVDSLNLTMDKIDQTTRNTFDQMKLLVEQAELGQINVVQTLSSRAQQIANTLPGSNTHPQLISTAPRYIHAKGQDVAIKCLGNFVHAATNGCEPILTFEGKDFKPKASSTQSLEFRVPSDVIFPPSTLSTATKIIYKDGTLKLPYPGGFLSSKGVATFYVTIGTLPTSPGKILLEWKEKGTPKKTTQVFKSNLLEVCSRSCCGNNDSEKVSALSPHEGWKVEIGSSRIQMVEEGGRRENPTFEREDSQNVTYRAKTIHNTVDTGGKESGWMKFHILFDEYKIEDTEDDKSEYIALKWNDTKAFNHPLGKWKVTYDSFDGRHTEFIGSDITSSPYIKVENQGSGFVIKAIDPKV